MAASPEDRGQGRGDGGVTRALGALDEAAQDQGGCDAVRTGTEQLHGAAVRALVLDALDSDDVDDLSRVAGAILIRLDRG